MVIFIPGLVTRAKHLPHVLATPPLLPAPSRFCLELLEKYCPTSFYFAIYHTLHLNASHQLNANKEINYLARLSRSPPIIHPKLTHPARASTYEDFTSIARPSLALPVLLNTVPLQITPLPPPPQARSPGQPAIAWKQNNIEMVENMTSVPAVISIVSDGDKVIVFGGKQLKAGGEDLFPNNVKTQVFVAQSGPDHIPCVGFELSTEHGTLHGPCSTGVHFQAQGETIKSTDSYSLSFGVSLDKVKVGTVRDKFSTRSPEFKAPPVIDANKKGADLIPLELQIQKVVDGGLDLVTYPPVVARGPNYGLVHNDEPFDGGVTISKILSSSHIVAYIPRCKYAFITDAVSHAEAATSIDPKRPFGIEPMDNYDREHLERNSGLLFTEPPIAVQRVTNWSHFRAAMVLGMGAETLPIQQDIEKLANTRCRATLCCADDGRLYAGFKLPRVQRGDFRTLLSEVNRGGRKVQICTLKPVAWDPTMRLVLQDRDRFPGQVLHDSPAGIDLPLDCDIVTESYPRRLDQEAIDATAKLSDLVASDGETQVDLRLQFSDETSQRRRFIANFIQRLDATERSGDDHQTNSDLEAHCTSEIGKKLTRNMLCGRGTQKFAFDIDHPIVPPYPNNEVDLLALTGAPAEDVLTTKIVLNTIGKLGAYSEFVQSVIRALPDGILSIEAFPGAGKTTVASAIDACLCLLSKDFRILIISGQNAALDSLNGNLDRWLVSAVTDINKDLKLDPAVPALQFPLVLRVSGNERSEVNELVRIVESRYEVGPDPSRPNTIYELWLQLLDAGPHRLPNFSKSGLTELAVAIKSQDSEGFRKLRQFVAGELTWDEANHIPETPRKGIISETHTEAELDNKLRSQRTAKDALNETISHILPLVNILVCTAATATKPAYSKFVETADLCQNEEAGATSCPQIFAGWRGIGQALIVSGDGAQFGPVRSYVKHTFQNYLAISTLDMLKNGGYPVFRLCTQHRAVDGQFDPVYENFYGDFQSIRSSASQHPDHHPDAQRVEAAFVAEFPGLQKSPAGRIVPIFINVTRATCKHDRTSRHRPGIKTSKHTAEHIMAATYVVKKLICCGIQPADIMVIGAYRAETNELRKTIPQDVLVTTADAAQGHERRYVVFVFSTTEETGPGFTRDPKRLCASMTRQKEFLALVGDIGAVDYENIDPFGKHENVHIANIHRYFVTRKRVANYEKIKETAKDAAEVPDPFTTDVAGGGDNTYKW